MCKLETLLEELSNLEKLGYSPKINEFVSELIGWAAKELNFSTSKRDHLKMTFKQWFGNSELAKLAMENGLDDAKRLALHMCSHNNWDYKEGGGRLDNKLLATIDAKIAFLEALCEREQPTAGHVVKIVTKEGVVESALISKVNEDTFEVAACGAAYVSNKNVSVTAGGNFFNVGKEHFEANGLRNRNYWFFGPEGGAHGGITVSVEMRQWLINDPENKLNLFIVSHAFTK